MLPLPESVKTLSPDSYSSDHASWHLIDVRTQEAFDESHIPGALNICVYEVVFGENMQKQFPALNAAICVTGESSGYHAADAAIQRLRDLGYTNVVKMEGGNAGWESSGFALESGGPPASIPEIAGDYTLDLASAKIGWTGRNPTNRHYGLIKPTSGNLVLDQSGIPSGGSVEVDMKQISCLDIEDPTMNSILIGHLSNADFFLSSEFPTAGFTIKEASRILGAPEGQANYSVTGEMSLRGKTLPLSVTALIHPTPEGYSFQTQFDLNRVLFGAVYGSGSIFEKLGMHLVNDLVSIEVIAKFAKS